MRIVWSPSARRRAEQAVDFIAEDRPRGAVEWFDGLIERVELLRTLPARDEWFRSGVMKRSARSCTNPFA